MRTRAKQFLAIALLAGISFSVVIKLSHRAGAEAGALAKDRLQLVWPSLMTMPDEDRALIVGLAMSCRLEQRPAQSSDVVTCLREAAADPHAILPKDIDQTTARERLERLLPRQT